MVGTPINFDTIIVKVLEKFSNQDIVVPLGNWIANDKGDNIRFGIWSGNNAVGFQNIVVKYAIKDDSIIEPILPGNIYDVELGENNLYVLKPYTDTSTLKGMVLYGDYYKNPSKDFVLTENKDVYTIVLFNTETKYLYGLSLPSKVTGQGLIKFSVINPDNIIRCLVKLEGQHAYLKISDEAISPSDKIISILGSNPFYGIIIIENRIPTSS
jgi:hypothetical protein